MSNTEKKNAGAVVAAPDANKSFEVVQLAPKDSAEWAGAPAIILRHFCGVAA
ncbi:hypothetical protein [Blastomonas sp.]|uniref:hypothetical protein n=1 Tax=Blastomonas sp. TaxID=1909299 RepID=UPI0035936734